MSKKNKNKGNKNKLPNSKAKQSAKVTDYEEEYSEDYYDEEPVAFEDDDLERIDLQQDSYTKNLSKYNLDDNIEEDEIEDSGRSRFLHIAFLIITIILIVVMVIFLVRWNKGKRIEITEEDLNSFDSESQDQYMVFSPYDNPDYVDDNELNIVILGDDSISNCTDETSIPNIIAKKTGGNVTTFALPGVTCAITNSQYDSNDPTDFYSFFYMANRIASEDFDPLKQTFDDLEDSSLYYDYWQRIHEYDFSKADIIIICYGSNDLIEGIPSNDKSQWEESFGTCMGTAGAMNYGLAVLKEAYPNAQIIVSSPTFFYLDDGKGGKVGADIKGNLGDYAAYILNASIDLRISFVDNYFGLGMTVTNKDGQLEDVGYLEDNGRYLNAKGRELVADHIISFFYFNREKAVVAQ